jgi:hypothetical protein
MPWHARGQGFKSPQLHPRSTALPAVDRPRIARLGQQIGSKLFCKGRSGRPERRSRGPAPSVSSRVTPGHRAAGGPVVRDEGPDRPSTARSITDVPGDRILIRVLHPGMLSRDLTCYLDEPCTAGNRCEPFGSDGEGTKRGPSRDAQPVPRGLAAARLVGIDRGINPRQDPGI